MKNNDRVYAECANCVSTMTMIAVWLGWFPETPTIFIFFLFLVWYSLTLPAASTIIFIYIFFSYTLPAYDDGFDVGWGECWFQFLHTETELKLLCELKTNSRRFHNHLRHVFQFFSSLAVGSKLNYVLEILIRFSHRRRRLDSAVAVHAWDLVWTFVQYFLIDRAEHSVVPSWSGLMAMLCVLQLNLPPLSCAHKNTNKTSISLKKMTIRWRWWW